MIQRTRWNFSQGQASKTEFLKRENQGPEFLRELAAVTNRTSGHYPVIDINDLVNSDYAALGRTMREYLNTAELRADTPYHCNCDNDYPNYGGQYSAAELPYLEFNYFAGGLRLVVDRRVGLVYLSSHYRTPYILEDGGAAPQILVKAAREKYNSDDAQGWLPHKKSFTASCRVICQH